MLVHNTTRRLADVVSDDVGRWLKELGLGSYAEAFAENFVDADLLPRLTNADLKDIGVIAVGHRRRLLEAIAELSEQVDKTINEAASEARPSGERTPEAERRQLTVMFCDLIGSTALSRQIDPEDLRDIMRRYQDAVAGAVTRYGGHVSKYLGDGVLAYFGWPRAYEDQAERAVRAGLESVSAVNDVRGFEERALEARVGIATGQVVVGELTGESGHDAESVSGETPNLAARLQQVAAPGQVVVGEATRRLVGQTFAFDDLGIHDLKGFDKRVQAWGVVGEVVAESRFEATHRGALTRFVGRDTELQLLLDRWQLAAGGEGQAVLISGEAGIGKSRLMQSLRDQVAEKDHIRMRYQCSPYHTNSALYPSIQQLEWATGFVPEEEDEAKLNKLEALLREAGEDLVKDAPLFANLLSLAYEDRYGAFTQSPQQIKERLLEALITQLLGLADQRPVLFLFEDAHWIDPTSLELLERAIGRLHQARVLLIITHRPEWQPTFAGHNHVTSLRLNRLGKAQGAEIARAIAGDYVLDDVVERIVSRTDGIPLFIEEITKSLVEGGLDIAEANIPATLQASLLARLDRLGTEAREIAQIGAVIGREFSHDLLVSVSDRSAVEIDAALERLTQSELIFHTGTPPLVKHIFKHALIQDSAYDSLLRARRQSLHGAIAEALERDFSAIAGSQPHILAHHYSNAGMAEKAVANWLEAGNRATRTSAIAEAYENLKQGLVDLDGLPQGAERDKTELDLQIALIGPLIPLRGHSALETKAASERAIELCRQTGETSRIFPALYGQWVNTYTRGNIVRTKELAENYLELANSQREIVPRVVGHRIMGTSSLVEGALPDALQHLEQAWALYDPSRDAAAAFNYSQDIGVLALFFLSWASCLTGHPDRANKLAHESVAHARSFEHTATMSITLVHIVMTAFLLRDRQTFKRLTAELQMLVDEHGLQLFQWVIAPFQGAILGWQGQPREGLEKVELGNEMMASGQMKLYQPFYLLIRSELLRDLGRTEDALAIIAEGLDVISATHEHWTEPEVHRVRGELYASMSQPSKAEAAFTTALAIASKQGAKWWELRAAVSLARLWQSQSKVVEARDLLDPIYNWFKEGFETPDLKDAKVLLDEMD